MSYYRRQRALAGVSTEIPSRMPVRYIKTTSLGSLGDDPPAGTTLSTPTILDPQTQAFQALVTDQLQRGVELMREANWVKWAQVAATLAIPLTTAIWKVIFKKGVSGI